MSNHGSFLLCLIICYGIVVFTVFRNPPSTIRLVGPPSDTLHSEMNDITTWNALDMPIRLADVNDADNSFARQTRSIFLPPVSFATKIISGMSLLVDVENKLIVCKIFKNGNTQFTAAFCRKFGCLSNIYNDSTHFTRMHSTTKIPHIKNVKMRDMYFSDPSWLKLAVIRDPIERLISAFVDKCNGNTIGLQSTCYNLSTNFTQFAYRFLKDIKSYSLTNTLPEMALFDHFMPQYWWCGFDKFYDNFKIIKMGNDHPYFAIKVRNELAHLRNWEPIIKTGWGPFGDSPFMEVKIHESPNKMKAMEIMELLQRNLGLTDMIYRTFDIDYLHFNLTIPRWIAENCDRSKAEFTICQDVLALYKNR